MGIFAHLHVGGNAALLLLRLLAAIFWAHGRMKQGTWKMQPSDQLRSSRLNILRTPFALSGGESSLDGLLFGI